MGRVGRRGSRQRNGMVKAQGGRGQSVRGPETVWTEYSRLRGRGGV